jgi:hypothetical protein
MAAEKRKRLEMVIAWSLLGGLGYVVDRWTTRKISRRSGSCWRFLALAFRDEDALDLAVGVLATTLLHVVPFVLGLCNAKMQRAATSVSASSLPGIWR